MSLEKNSVENKRFKFKNYATFSNSPLWKTMLKPDLQKMIDEVSFSEDVPDSQFESAKRDIVRATTIKTIKRIYAMIEGADNKLNRLSKPHG